MTWLLFMLASAFLAGLSYLAYDESRPELVKISTIFYPGFSRLSSIPTPQETSERERRFLLYSAIFASGSLACGAVSYVLYPRSRR
jgi:hypothetical protein